MSNPRGNIEGLDSIADECEAVLLNMGIVGRPLVSTCGASVGYESALPTARGIMRARSWVSPPTEVSGRLGRKIRKKLKKVVKSRAFKVLGKLAKAAASVVPGGAALVTAATIAEKAAKAIKKAKNAAKVSGDTTLLNALPGALQQGAAEIRAERFKHWQVY
jgi:hypothetical protein